MRLFSLVLLVPFCISPLLCQGEETKRDLPLGTIDVAYIFRTHKEVAERLLPLRATVQELEQKIQLRQAEIEQVQRKLNGPAQPGEDRGKMQVQIAKMQTELRVFVEKEKQSLQRQELQIQAKVYKEIQAEVKRISQERGLKLVVVRPRGSLETEDLTEMNRTLNQLVIYEEEGLDLTDEVLKALEEKAKPE